MKFYHKNRKGVFTLFLILILTTNLNAHIDDEALYNFEKKCMACHDTYKKTKLAPPIIAINRIYKDKYDNIDDAKKGIISFLNNPQEKTALMKPAIKIFGLMPKQVLTIEEMNDFTSIILELEYEKQEWFEKHYKSHKLDLEHKEIP